MSDNNNDDIEDMDIDDFDDSGFDDYAEKGTLADLWKNNPMVKVGVILAAFVLIVAAVILFGGRDAELPVSRVTRASDVTEAPGTAEVTPAFQKAIEEENVRRTEEALQQNESALPMPVEPPKSTLGLQIEDEPEEDPLERWRRMQEERIRQQQVVQQDFTEPEVEEQKPDTRTPAVNALSEAMGMQMEAVLGNQQIKAPQIKSVTNLKYLDEMTAKQRAEEEARLAAFQASQTAPANVQNILIPAGTIEYAQLLTEANTDAPGPILAQIMSGPFQGSRILGTFQATHDYLTLNFSSISIDGVTIGINAVAIDPNTTLPGMVTEIDRRYFSRIILPMAAEFVTGLADAVSDSGRTSVTITGETVATSTQNASREEEVASGIKEAGDAASDLIEQEAAAIQPLLRVAAGTPLGILFVAPVVESQGNTQIQPASQGAGAGYYNNNSQNILIAP